MTALELFRGGMGTIQIAAYLGCSEAEIYNELHSQREEERLRNILCVNRRSRPPRQARPKKFRLIRAAGC